MNNSTSCHAQLQSAKYTLLDAARAQGFSAYEARAGPTFHDTGITVRVKGEVGKNAIFSTYSIMYCPIQDGLVTHKEEEIFMRDLPLLDEFVAKTKSIDAVFENLAPPAVVLDQHTSCLTGRTR